MTTRLATLLCVLALAAPARADITVRTVSMTIVDDTPLYHCGDFTCDPGLTFLESLGLNPWQIYGRYATNSAENNVKVYLPDSQPLELLVFLPGGGAKVSSYEDFMLRAAVKGYRVIGLNYRNQIDPEDACCTPDGNCTHPFSPSRASQCYADFHEQVVHGAYKGADYLDDVEGTAWAPWHSQASIEDRLEAVLERQIAQHPSENWSMFFNHLGKIDWSKITIVGHSQGGKHAAFIAKRHQVAKVLLFASPGESTTSLANPTPPAWMSAHGLTNPLCFYALSVEGDKVDAHEAAWDALDIPDENRFIMNPSSLACAAVGKGAHHEAVMDCSNKHFQAQWDAMLTATCF